MKKLQVNEDELPAGAVPSSKQVQAWLLRAAGRPENTCPGICGLRMSDLRITRCVDPNRELGTNYVTVGKCGFCGVSVAFKA